MTVPPHTKRRVTLRQFAWLSLVLGITGFGGGFAVAQRVRQHVVDRLRWLDAPLFMEHFAVASALPGTAATNLLTILGYRVAGFAGAACGALGFLAPSIVLMMMFGAAYDGLRAIHALSAFFDGMALATVGVVAAVAVDMRRAAILRRIDWLLAIGATLTLALRWLNLIEVIGLSGLVGALMYRPSDPGPRSRQDSFPPASLRSVAPITLLALLPLFTVFARIGIATFGGGFAMIAPLEHEVVVNRHWLDESAFNDAMVFGQITPGPVAIAATFIGFRVAGPLGALLATAGMFGPPFLLSIAAAKSIASFRGNPSIQGFLAGIAPAVVGIIAAAAISLARTTLHDPVGVVMACAAFVLLVWRPTLSPMVPLFGAGALRMLGAVLHIPFGDAFEQ